MARAVSPSHPDRVDGNEETAVFARNGYVVVVPDHIGPGVSTVPQACVIAGAHVNASVDLRRAVRSALARCRRGSMRRAQ